MVPDYSIPYDSIFINRYCVKSQNELKLIIKTIENHKNEILDNIDKHPSTTPNNKDEIIENILKINNMYVDKLNDIITKFNNCISESDTFIKIRLITNINKELDEYLKEHEKTDDSFE